MRPVELLIHSSDRRGLLANVSQSFHNAGINITAVNCRTSQNHRAINNFTVLVGDVEQLNRVIRNIERINGVVTVERVSNCIQCGHAIR